MEKNPKGKYEDIINLPHHVSKTHPQMPLYDRAAQFSPFAALTGYEDAIRETARLTNNWVQLSEDKKHELDEKFQLLMADREKTESVTITFFQPDERKEGGSYRTVTGQIRKIDMYKRKVFLKNGMEIELEKIVEINESGEKYGIHMQI